MSLRLIRRAGSGVWQITGTVAGTRVRESTRTSKRSIAEQMCSQRENELHRAAIFGGASVVTWAQAVLRYIETRQPRPGQSALLHRLTEHFGSSTLLREIDQDRVDAAVRAICSPGVSPATRLRGVISPIRAVLTVAARRGWCALPSFEVPKGASGVKRTRWLTPNEFCRLRDSAAPHLQPLIVFLVGTGARLGSALALDWPDADLTYGRALLRDTKNGNDHTVELPPAAVAAMAAIDSREGRVFRTDDGAAYPSSEGGGGQIGTAWATACRKAGFAGEWHEGKPGIRRERRLDPSTNSIVVREWPIARRWWTPTDVTLHVLRHTWASWRYAFHKDLLRLKAEGDWSSVSLCERYAKLVPAGMLPAIVEAWGMDSGAC